MTTTATGNFPELLWPGIATLWGLEYNKYKPLYKRFMQMKKSDKAFEKEQGVTGLPLAAIKNEGESVNFVNPLQGFQKEYVNVTYALGTIITREMMEDEQYNYINEIPGMLAESMRQTEETISANLLNNGFGTTTTADGLSLFNASHSNVGGGTQRNQLSTASDLSQAALEQAVIDLMDFKDERGLRIMVTPELLLVPTALRFTAEKILGTKYAVGSNDNDINPIEGLMPLQVNPYLTDSDAWFIKTNVRNGTVFYNRRTAELARDNEFDTENLKFKQSRRFAVGTTDWRGWFGTAGA
jgi:hypothetical protein